MPEDPTNPSENNIEEEMVDTEMAHFMAGMLEEWQKQDADLFKKRQMAAKEMEK